MESNIKIKDTPKLNISSAVFGDKDSAGNSTGSIRNIHKTLSKLSGHVRKSLIRIKGLEEKFSKVESKTEVDNVGKKLSGGSNVNQSLVETNRILVEIQKQITTAFGMRNEEEKEKNKTLKQEKSKEKLRLKEGVIESVRKIGGAIKKTAQFVAAPFKGFFDKILEFITLLGLGIGANAVFKWLQDEENRRKMGKFFNIIVSNWKLIRNILGTMVVAGLAMKIVSLATSIGGVLAFLANPVTLAVLTVLAGALAVPFISDKINEDKRRKAYGEGNMDKGLFAIKMLNNYGNRSSHRDKMTDQEKSEYTTLKGYNELLMSRQQDNQRLYAATKNGGSAETISQLEQVIAQADSSLRQMEDSTQIQGQSISDLFSAYKATGITPQTTLTKSGLEYRAMGGPVSAKTPYLVGEEGPEIFAPNVDGSIVNNMRTEKIYQMISSKDAGKINFITMELPPKVMKKEQQDSTQQTAPPVPSISPVNGSNPYMNITPEIYGIYV